MGTQAPEIIRGEDITDRADVWSFACLCVEMLTKAMPFHQYSNNLTVTFKIGSANLHPDVPSSAPVLLQHILESAFQVDVMQRPSTLTIRHDLETVVHSLRRGSSPMKSKLPLLTLVEDEGLHGDGSQGSSSSSNVPVGRHLLRHKSLPSARRRIRELVNSDYHTLSEEESHALQGHQLHVQAQQLASDDSTSWHHFVAPDIAVLRNKATRLEALKKELQIKERRLKVGGGEPAVDRQQLDGAALSQVHTLAALSPPSLLLLLLSNSGMGTGARSQRGSAEPAL